MFRRVLVALGLAACGDTIDVRIELQDADDNCGAAFGSIHSLSIEAVARDGRCLLRHRCAYDAEGLASVDDVAAALRAAGDILLELDAAEAQALVINGRPLNDCFSRGDDLNHPVLCGSQNLDAAAGGRLVIELEPNEAGSCPESIDLCE